MIIEETLGIPGDYQYKAIRSKNFFQSNWHQNKLDIVNRYLHKGKLRILDLGTGSGNLELALASQHKQIIGVDYYAKALDFLKQQLAKNNIGNVKLIQTDIRKAYKIADKDFDAIVMMDVIEHIPQKDAEKMVQQMKDKLHKGGQFIIVTPNQNSGWLLLEKLLDYFHIFPHMAGEQHLAKYNKENLRLMMEKAGYKTNTLRTFNLIAYLLPNKQWSKTLNYWECQSGLPWGNLLLGVFDRA